MRVVLVTLIFLTAVGDVRSCEAIPRLSALVVPVSAEFAEAALPPLPLFMAHARAKLAYAIRRWIEPYARAFAGHPSDVSPIWEFEPATPDRRSSYFSQDRSARSGDSVREDDDPVLVLRAKGRALDFYREEILGHEPRRGRVSKERRTLERTVVQALLSEGLPLRLARDLGHQLILAEDKTLEDPLVWRSLGHDLSEEINELPKVHGVSRDDMALVLEKLVWMDVLHLWDWLGTVAPDHCHPIMAAAIRAKYPVEAAMKAVDALSTAPRRRSNLRRTKWMILMILGPLSAAVGSGHESRSVLDGWPALLLEWHHSGWTFHGASRESDQMLLASAA